MINMGHSLNHASTVPLVLNPNTGYFQTPFNVVFDDWFATIASDHTDLPDFNSPKWAKVFGDSKFQYTLDDEDFQDMIDLSDPNDLHKIQHQDGVAPAMDENRQPIQALPLPPSDSDPTIIRSLPTDLPSSEPYPTTIFEL